jgi:hypothetical protein
MATVLTISAGRSFRRSQSAKWVDPQPEKGTIEVRPDQGILTFLWRNKETQNAEDELLIFPGEANFERVPADKSGRTFVLKFNSSNQTHFVSSYKANKSQRAASDSYSSGSSAARSTPRLRARASTSTQSSRTPTTLLAPIPSPTRSSLALRLLRPPLLLRRPSLPRLPRPRPPPRPARRAPPRAAATRTLRASCTTGLTSTSLSPRLMTVGP